MASRRCDAGGVASSIRAHSPSQRSQSDSPTRPPPRSRAAARPDRATLDCAPRAGSPVGGPSPVRASSAAHWRRPAGRCPSGPDARADRSAAPAAGAHPTPDRSSGRRSSRAVRRSGAVARSRDRRSWPGLGRTHPDPMSANSRSPSPSGARPRSPVSRPGRPRHRPGRRPGSRASTRRPSATCQSPDRRRTARSRPPGRARDPPDRRPGGHPPAAAAARRHAPRRQPSDRPPCA